jgi:hypothetical protein
MILLMIQMNVAVYVNTLSVTRELIGKMNFNDELEAVSFLEKNGISVSTEQCIFLPKKSIYENDIHETIDFLIDVYSYTLHYI